MLIYERDTIVPAPGSVNEPQQSAQQEDMDIDSNSSNNGPVQQLEDEVMLLF
jgi:hypothetical protein